MTTLHVLHLFCDGVLAETRVFAFGLKARQEARRALLEVGVGTDNGEAIDANGSIWSWAIEKVEVE